MSKFIPIPVVQPSPRSVGAPADRPFAEAVPAEPRSPTGGKRHVELSNIHDFASKLCQPDILPRLRDYVAWQAAERGRAAGAAERGAPPVGLGPDAAPISINLDITTACNYACDHCVDMEILNTGIKYDHQKLLDSLALMAEKGLRSVIVIGGGEPTVYPKFGDAIRFMKGLGLQVAVVSNGSGMKKIEEVADCLTATDWVRLSLDSASDDVFQRMHKPKKAITLDQICEGVARVRALGPRFKIGFSFIVTWKSAYINETYIVENIHEIVPAAERARRYGFDYISYKPFLTRAPENQAEVVDLKEQDQDFETVIARIRTEVDEAKKFATPTFSVYEATNLKVLENRSYKKYTEQPHTCHMQFFRQVLSPLGLFNCPVYRNQEHGKVGGKEGYASPAEYEAVRHSTARLIADFDATRQCREVTCLYNHVNWWIEELIADPRKLDAVPMAVSAAPDYFL